MSGAFPTSPKFRTLNFQNNRPTLMNQSISGRRAVRQIGSQYFTFSVSMPPLDQDDAMDVFAFLQKQKGSFETFTIQLPTQNRGADKTNTSVKVVGAHNTTDNTISLDGFTASTTGVLKAGDLIKFSHGKVYMVQSDINSDSGGAATVTIEPNLVETLADNEVVTMNQPSFTVYLPSEEILYATDPTGFYSISFDVREVIS
ncbi:hypothetical protein OAV94_01025 [Candidatus Pelagibacter sp.]|nr:hypothetical protein [Candidatus Pelagibacter sp.]